MASLVRLWFSTFANKYNFTKINDNGTGLNILLSMDLNRNRSQFQCYCRRSCEIFILRKLSVHMSLSMDVIDLVFSVLVGIESLFTIPGDL